MSFLFPKLLPGTPSPPRCLLPMIASVCVDLRLHCSSPLLLSMLGLMWVSIQMNSETVATIHACPSDLPKTEPTFSAESQSMHPLRESFPQLSHVLRYHHDLTENTIGKPCFTGIEDIAQWLKRRAALSLRIRVYIQAHIYHVACKHL